MEEKTLFKLARAITDTGTDTVSSKGGTVTYRITSLKRKLVNGKVVSTSTPSCTLGSASVSWATWGGVTVGDGYLDVKINYSENTGSSRSTTLIFTQNGSDNKINLTVTQGSSVTYTGYIEMVSNTLPLGNNKGDTAQILVRAYLKGSDGSKKPETPHVGSAPDWCSVSVVLITTLENHYMLTLTALSSNQTGDNRKGHIFLTCGDANLSIPVTQGTARDDGTSGLCILTQNESGNKINLHLTTPEEKEYWEIRFNPIITLNGVDTSAFFKVTTNISGELGSMADGTRYKDWIVNQNRHTINVYISSTYSKYPENLDILSWSCFEKDGSSFSPNYSLPNNQYFTTKPNGLGSYTLTKVSTPSVGNGTLILSSRFNTNKKYPLDLNFYWGLR